MLVHLNDEALIREETLSEIFSFRGLGKSMFSGSLIKILTLGGEFLGIKSKGGYRVLLVDGELPSRLLQKRLLTLVGTSAAGLLRVRSLRKVKNRMPPLVDPAEQQKFFLGLKMWRPEVIIFDTRTAIFKHDTNNPEQLMSVNEFLMQLRAEGYAVILTHHAGKNGTQRGRTDNDDPLDLSIQLNPCKGAKAGQGLQFTMSFEKVRYGDRLEEFDARWTKAGGWERDLLNKNVINSLLAGKSLAAVAKEWGISKDRVTAIRDKAKKNGITFPVNKSGPKKAAKDESSASAA